MEDGGWRSIQKSTLYLHSLSSLRPSSIYEIDKFPAPFDACDSHPVTIIIEAGIRKLRRRDPEFAFLREPLSHDSFQLRPEIVFIPVLENTVTFAVLRGAFAKDVGKVFRHHAGDGVHVMRRDGFL